MEPLRILSSENHLLDNGEGEGEVVLVATRPMHLRVLGDDLLFIRISPVAAPEAADDVDGYPINEFEPCFVSMAKGEQLSVVRGSENTSPVFVSIGEVKRVLA